MFGRKRVSLKKKLEMWDYVLAGLASGSDVIEPNDHMGLNNIELDFNGIHSASYMTRYFLISKIPDWMYPRLVDAIRMNCIDSGVKVNVYFYGSPYRIDWNSDEMKNRMAALKRFSDSAEGSEEEVSVFEYRKKRQSILAKQRILNSMEYLNKADLDYRRTLWLASVLVEISGKRGSNGKYLYRMKESISNFKRYCSSADLEYRELKINIQDWLTELNPFSLKYIREIDRFIVKKVMTDDIMATLFNSYKQGKIGKSGVLVGTDISSKSPVLVDFRDNKDSAENWLITATTGGGKSFFVKHMLMWIVANNITVTVVDFEGDEYKDMAAFMKASNPEDVSLVSMGKGTNVYCDPMPIPNLTGNADIDDELKDNAMGFTMKIFQTIINSGEGTELTKWQSSVLSEAIRNVYNDFGVTDDKSTWPRSKTCTITDVYDELKLLVKRKVFVDESMDNIKHKAAVDIVEACKPYFEEGEAKYGAFKNQIDVDALYKSKFIVFSFGEKGKTASEMDKVALQLKQLSVANISNQISNYHKYVLKSLNVKVWEEYQRWGSIPGSSEIIKNIITGGRKRGDINFIITNDLAAILDDRNENNKTIRDNLTSYAVGKLKDMSVIDEFVTKCRLEDLRQPLMNIADATKLSGSRYYHAFCVVMRDSEKAVVSVRLPDELATSSLYGTLRGTN